MLITGMTIRGEGGEVEIARTDDGALITAGGRVICEVGRRESDEARFAKVQKVALAIYGADRMHRINATNSMIHDVRLEIERVAGC
ncbi:MAG: hypothetical protein IT430_15955 [Phycisphaerales bacterium]|nr:hypothetical protein [Phycisphaerales bacterium]